VSIDQVAGPVGEALVMTAAGLAVALPAVLGYNIFGRRIARLEADLEGFAFDLRDLLAPSGKAAAHDDAPALDPAASLEAA
jgi:biopolymer transport protein ExbB